MLRSCRSSVKEAGLTSVMVNCNPEPFRQTTIPQTNFILNPSQKNMFSPLFIENPRGISYNLVPTPLKLSHKIGPSGTSADAIDLCEDRERFNDLMNRLEFTTQRCNGDSKSEAIAAADDIGQFSGSSKLCSDGRRCKSVTIPRISWPLLMKPFWYQTS